MHVPFVDLKAQYESIKEEIDDAIKSAIDKTFFVGGDIIDEFVTAFANYIGVKHCIGVANGTDALEISLKALGVGPGDEVIVPALTWVSTALAVNNVGAEPVFIDVLEQERTINPGLIESKITSRTKAIIPVHLYGLPAYMSEICAVAKKNHIKVIEDCAQAHGADIAGKKVGSFGDLATFSFYPSKNLGAYGDAGAIVSDSGELSSRCRALSNLGQEKKHDHKLIGRNSRLDSLQAAILKVKLKHLDEWIEKRMEVAAWYEESLTNASKPIVPAGFKHVFHLYVIQNSNRDDLFTRLSSHNIGSEIHYPKPLPFVGSYEYKKHLIGDFPIAERLCSEILSLPMYAELERKNIHKIADVVNEK